jgi:hypothetical protein
MVVTICRRNKSPIRGLFLDRDIAEPNELIDIDMIQHFGYANEIYDTDIYNGIQFSRCSTLERRLVSP